MLASAVTAALAVAPTHHHHHALLPRNMSNSTGNHTSAALNASNVTPAEIANVTISSQANFSSYRPPCRTSLFGHCEQGGVPSPSPTYRCGRTAAFLDPGLVTHLVAILADKSVIEFGAGAGCYAGAIHDTPSALPVRNIEAFDHRPDLFGNSEGLVRCPPQLRLVVLKLQLVACTELCSYCVSSWLALLFLPGSLCSAYAQCTYQDCPSCNRRCSSLSLRPVVRTWLMWGAPTTCSAWMTSTTSRSDWPTRASRSPFPPFRKTRMREWFRRVLIRCNRS